MQFPFDPVERAHEVESIVMDGNRRRYYRVRYAKFYNGIVTADSAGCDFLCAYCWNYRMNSEIETTSARFYSPDEVASKLSTLRETHNTKRYRISGCEPILGEISARHVGRIIELMGKGAILETNGLMLGYGLSLLDFIPKKAHFRVTIKADSPKSFEKITGAKASAYQYQIKAIQALTDQNRPFTLAFMKEFVDIDTLAMELAKADIDFGDTMPQVDIEGLLYYPQNIKSMKERGVGPLYKVGTC